MKKKKVDLFNVNRVNPQILNKEHFDKLFSKKHLTLGQKAVDIITKFVGSWHFFLFFIFIIFLWIVLNTFLLLQWNKPSFDPYPYILLNLVLGGISAIQAPIILMSQNREAERDRIQAHYDYAVNKKAEKEIRDIQKDIDYIKRKLSTL